MKAGSRFTASAVYRFRALPSPGGKHEPLDIAAEAFM
jgi:hypothetical protein